MKRFVGSAAFGLASVVRVASVASVASVALLASVAGAVTSCSKCARDDDEPRSSALVEAPVPAPEALLADVYLGGPNALWTRLQRGVAGPASILPATAGGLLTVGLGIDPSFAQEIDGASPGYGVVAGDPADPAWAFALRLVDLRRARGILVDGDAARFDARDVAGLTELSPKGATPASGGLALGLTRGGWLVVARSSAELGTLAPYAARTLPARPLPSGGAVVVDVPRAALASRVKPKLEAAWAGWKALLLAMDERTRQEHGGRAPDYGDPRAIVGAIDALVSRRLSVVGDLERVRLTLDVGEDGARLVASMLPASADGPATKWLSGMRTGDAEGVLAFPVTSALAITTLDTDAARAEQGREVERVLAGTAGARLAEVDAKRLHDVVDDWTKARGEALGASIQLDEPRGVFLRSAVRDAEAAGRAVRGLVDLTRATPFKDVLRVRDVSTSSEDAPPLGKVSVAVLTRDPPAGRAGRSGRDASAPAARRSDRGDGAVTTDKTDKTQRSDKPSTLGLAWLVDGTSLGVAVGSEPAFVLRHGARPDRKLSDEPAVVKALAPLGKDASTILVAQPLRLDPSRANLPAAPVVIGVGRLDKEAFVRVDVSNGLLREATRYVMMR